MNLEDKLCPISCCISGKLLSLECTYARNGRALAHASPYSTGLHPTPRSLTEFLIILPFSVVTIICIKWSGWKMLSHIRLFVTPLPMQSMEFSRPEYWSGLLFPFPMHESGKWKVKVKLLSRNPMLTSIPYFDDQLLKTLECCKTLVHTKTQMCLTILD